MAPACEESLQIQQPVIIAGEPDAAFPIHGETGPAVIRAPPGQPCAVIAVGPRGGVEFRDVTLEAPHGGGSACIQSWGSAVALVRSTVVHSGEASAIYASGGQLYFSDAEIDGASEDSVIWAEDAAIVFKNVGVKAVSTAIDIRPGGANSVLLDHVTLYAPPGEADRTATGLLARRSHTLNGHFEMHHVHISGFRNGVVAETGVDLRMDRVLISHARLGVAVNGAKVDYPRQRHRRPGLGRLRLRGSGDHLPHPPVQLRPGPHRLGPWRGDRRSRHLRLWRPLQLLRPSSLGLPGPPFARRLLPRRRFHAASLGLGRAALGLRAASVWLKRLAL